MLIFLSALGPSGSLVFFWGDSKTMQKAYLDNFRKSQEFQDRLLDRFYEITPRPPDPSTNATNIKLNMTIR